MHHQMCTQNLWGLHRQYWLFAQMATLTHTKKTSPQNNNTGGPDSTTQPHKEPALVRTDWVDPESHIMRQKPKGMTTVIPAHFCCVPPASRCIWMSAAFIQMCSIITIWIAKRKLPSNLNHRYCGHMLVQCANRKLLTSHCSASAQWGH